jgi:hypothetical protein
VIPKRPRCGWLMPRHKTAFNTRKAGVERSSLHHQRANRAVGEGIEKFSDQFNSRQIEKRSQSNRHQNDIANEKAPTRENLAPIGCFRGHQISLNLLARHSSNSRLCIKLEGRALAGVGNREAKNRMLTWAKMTPSVLTFVLTGSFYRVRNRRKCLFLQALVARTGIEPVFQP